MVLKFFFQIGSTLKYLRFFFQVDRTKIDKNRELLDPPQKNLLLGGSLVVPRHFSGSVVAGKRIILVAKFSPDIITGNCSM